MHVDSVQSVEGGLLRKRIIACRLSICVHRFVNCVLIVFCFCFSGYVANCSLVLY